MLHHCALALQVTKQHEQLRGILQKRIFLFPDINVHLNTKYKKHFDVSNYLSLFFFLIIFFNAKGKSMAAAGSQEQENCLGKALIRKKLPHFPFVSATVILNGLTNTSNIRLSGEKVFCPHKQKQDL